MPISASALLQLDKLNLKPAETNTRAAAHRLLDRNRPDRTYPVAPPPAAGTAEAETAAAAVEPVSADEEKSADRVPVQLVVVVVAVVAVVVVVVLHCVRDYQTFTS